MSPPPARGKFAKTARKKAKPRAKVKRRDPIFIDGARPRPMFVDYKDLELLGKLVNRQAKILGRRREGVQIYYRIINDKVVSLCRAVCVQIASESQLSA